MEGCDYTRNQRELSELDENWIGILRRKHDNNQHFPTRLVPQMCL